MSHTPPLPRTAAEQFITIVRCLSAAVTAMMAGNQLPASLIKLVVDRLRGIQHRFVYLAARLRDGTHVVRQRAATASKRPGQPPPQNPLPTSFGWVLPLLPIPQGGGFRSQLDFLLNDPEMAALLEAAPASLRRPVRSLCRMLGLEPPPILALPAPQAAGDPPGPRTRRGRAPRVGAVRRPRRCVTRRRPRPRARWRWSTTAPTARCELFGDDRRGRGCMSI